MKKEIGSEFWDVPVTKNAVSLLPGNAQWYLSGRAALMAILTDCCVRSIALPSWCCDSIVKPFWDAGIRVGFYPVLGKEQTLSQIRADALVLMDFFGFSGYSPVPRDYSGIVIRDLTHSAFSGIQEDADYYFGSLRKWAGFWTGGFAWKQDGTPLPEGVGAEMAFSSLRKQAMEEKRRYLEGQAVSKAYLDMFRQAESILDNATQICLAEQRDIDLAQKMDVARIRRIRRENASILMDALGEYCIFPEMKEQDCPLFVPVRVSNRDAVRKYMIDQSVYCPVHWPLTAYHRISPEQAAIYHSEISLICDQRYDAQDMGRIIRAFKEGIQAC